MQFILSIISASRTYNLRAIMPLFVFVFCFSSGALHAQSCDCDEYLYLNETSNGGAVHKFRIDADGSLTEINPTNQWYPNGTANELPVPHGLAFDDNGNVYIGETKNLDSDIRKLDCDGNLSPASEFAIIDEPIWNSNSIGNTMFVNSVSGAFPFPRNVRTFDLCDGSYTGDICLELDNGTAASTSWGMYQDPVTMDMYVFAQEGNGSVFKFNESNINGACVTPIATDLNASGIMSSLGEIQGITVDPNGNIYLVNNDGWSSTPAQILKYDPNGNLVCSTGFDNVDGDGGWHGAVGLIYSPSCDCLLSSNFSFVDDCVSQFDLDCNYLGAAVDPIGNVSNNTAPIFGKGIAIRVECCPINANTSETINVCDATVGDVFLIQEYLPCDSICAGSWTEVSNIAGTFDSCNNAVTFQQNGEACYSYDYVPTGTNLNEICSEFHIDICLTFSSVIANAGVDQEICAGENATLTASATGTGPYTYAWDNSLGAEASQIVSPSTSTTYTVTVTDANGCTATDAATITIIDSPEATVSSTDPTCGLSNGTITLTFLDNPNRTNIEFSLDGGVTYPYDPADDIGSFTVSDLAPGAYDLWVRWGNTECPVDLPDVTLVDQTGPATCFDITITRN